MKTLEMGSIVEYNQRTLIIQKGKVSDMYYSGVGIIALIVHMIINFEMI